MYLQLPLTHLLVPSNYVRGSDSSRRKSMRIC